MKYVTRASTYTDSYYDNICGDTVYEEIREPVDTYLLDVNGNSIYRLPEKRPVGFFMRK
jgi:hypothetical protein